MTTMMTVGFGDIAAANTTERIFTMIAMFTMAAVYLFVVNIVSQKVSEFNFLATNFKEKLDYLNQWMLLNCIPYSLKMSITRLLEYEWEQKKLIKIEEEEVLKMVNADLRDKLIIFMKGRHL